MITITHRDIQKLSKKYYGDELTQKELRKMEALVQPKDWIAIAQRRWEGTLFQFITTVVTLIGEVRGGRRGGLK